ncbi:MAG: hypothetical protein ACXWLS_12030 [Myxococcaceae bacterium]
MPTPSHTLADFRTDHVAVRDDLRTPSGATLLAEGLVQWNRVAQDGRRVRARAGAASFRRRPTPEEARAEARQPVAALREEVEEDPAATDRRPKAARERAARERVEGIKRAWERGPEWVARKTPDERDRARGATTDASAPVRKRADGGFRPASHVPFATDTGTPGSAGAAVETAGRGAGQRVPRGDQVEDRSGTVPPDGPVDGGLAPHDPIDAVSAPERSGPVSAPVPPPKDPKVDRFAPQPGASGWRPTRPRRVPRSGRRRPHASTRGRLAGG